MVINVTDDTSYQEVERVQAERSDQDMQLGRIGRRIIHGGGRYTGGIAQVQVV